MRTLKFRLLIATVFLLSSNSTAFASIFGQVHGIVHDPQHRPVKGAAVTLRAGHSALTFHTASNADGAFQINSVPLGDYIVSVSVPGFAEYRQIVTLDSNSAVICIFNWRSPRSARA